MPKKSKAIMSVKPHSALLIVLVFSILGAFLPTSTLGAECNSSGSITIGGTDTPVNGSQYTASGGVAPYLWSISRGSIDQQGVVGVSGQCGVGTVAVTDSCGQTYTKTVRLPVGQWVQTYAISRGCEWASSGWTSCGLVSGSIVQGSARTDWYAAIDRSRVAPGTPICPDLSKGWCVGLGSPPTGACAKTAPGVDLSNCWNTNGVWYGLLPVVTAEYTWQSKCNVAITDLVSNKSKFSPYIGETVTISGKVNEGYGNPKWWTFKLAGRKISGDSSTFSFTWDGKDVNGALVSPGSYSASVYAGSCSNDCIDTKTVSVEVAPLCVDADLDGHFQISGLCPGSGDCNDNDAAIYPGAPELCDNKDNDCDGQVDEAKFLDNDGDTFFGSQLEGCPTAFIKDCNDNDNSIKPGASEKCGDLIDNNCNVEKDENCSSNSCLVSPS